MTLLADMNRNQVFSWLQEHGPVVGVALDELEEAVNAFARKVSKCDGAWERTGATAADVAESIMNTAIGSLAEEVRRDLGR